MRLTRIHAVTATAILLAACGPTKQNPERAQKPTAKIPVQSAPSPWRDATTRDNFTDQVTPGIVSVDKSENGVFLLKCSADWEEASFVSDFFLGIRHTGTVRVRLDDEPPKTFEAAMSDTVARLRMKTRDYRQVDDVLLDAEAMGFLSDLAKPNRKRLRVRLVAITGDVEDLDFDVTAVQQKLRALEQTCRAQRSSEAHSAH